VDNALDALRKICADLLGAVETLTFGNPTFKAGKKSFAVLDSYKGVDCLWVRVDPGRRAELLNKPGWFKSPYDPREQALCWDLRDVDWDTVEALVRDSYRIAKT
jgi:predicted DNA-binding protein (MmcQ/YjbR family)